MFYFVKTQKTPFYVLERGKQTIFSDTPQSGDIIVCRLSEEEEMVYKVTAPYAYLEIAKRACFRTEPLEINSPFTKLNFNLLVSGEWDYSPEIEESWVLYKNFGESQGAARVQDLRQGEQLFCYATYHFPTEETVGGWGVCTEEEYYSFFNRLPLGLDKPEINIEDAYPEDILSL
jgi:hypothetical protein